MAEQYAHNGKQSQSTREELFIAIQYLLDECPNKSHASKTIRLTTYAEEKFGVFLDRRRANAILEDLVRLTNEYPNVLPYKIVKIENKPRYYLKRTLFEEKDIKAISNALITDSNLSKSASKKLTSLFLDKVCNKEDKQKLEEKLDEKQKHKKYAPPEKSRLISYFETLRDFRLRFSFKFKKSPKILSVSCERPIRVVINSLDRRANPNAYIGGIIYDTFFDDNENQVCVYLQDYRVAVITDVSNIEFQEDFEPVEQINEPTFELERCKYPTIDEWIDAYYRGQTGFKMRIKFKFWIGKLEDLKPKYESFFKTRMEYELQDREARYINWRGEEVVVPTQDVVTSVICNFKSFEKWYWESRGFDSVVVLEPAFFNNRLLEERVARFQRRLEKYGAQPIEEEK